MQLGYLRVSKADGSQVLDLQRDALLAAGVEAGQLYQDLASGKSMTRPWLRPSSCPQGAAFAVGLAVIWIRGRGGYISTTTSTAGAAGQLPERTRLLYSGKLQ